MCSCVGRVSGYIFFVIVRCVVIDVQVVKKLTMKKAYEVTMETHKAGKATVTQAWKSKVCIVFR